MALYRYDPFGNVMSSSGADAATITYRFSSKEAHDRSGLYYYGYRWYAPNLQRWVNRDPLGDFYGVSEALEGRRTPRVIPWEKSEGPNLYQAVANNPLAFIDSDGRGKLGVPPQDRDQNWITDCMLACDNVICKSAPYPAECIKACYDDCMDLKIPNLTCIFKGPKGPKPKITPK
jgi:RHS repeat-associated protein